MALAQEFEDEARRLTQTGWIRGIEVAGVDESAVHYVAGAEERVEEASGVVAEAPNQEDPALLTLQDRVGTTKRRIADIRLRLGHDSP